jgi:hypothetical protein
VVTIQSTNLCLAKKQMISLRPDEIKLEVYPRKRLRGSEVDSLASLCVNPAQVDEIST